MTFTTPLKNGGKFPLLALGHVGGHVTSTTCLVVKIPVVVYDIYYIDR